MHFTYAAVAEFHARTNADTDSATLNTPALLTRNFNLVSNTASELSLASELFRSTRLVGLDKITNSLCISFVVELYGDRVWNTGNDYMSFLPDVYTRIFL